ncbi:MAG: RNA-directed DNA polymerase [Candidatus Obscuribacter sp.]|nr:RNA-directed DNA polymerase [Candidatus Obscuribacter sp.]MBK9277460.1 RNA-directed DNA polymerase [Candidatus Obscuribacter sp.]
MTHQDSKLTIDDIGNKLGVTPQFLLEAASAASTQYELFDLPKKSGGTRTICSPKNELKRLQRTILEELLHTFAMPDYVHGCVKGRSIVTNAKPHTNKPLVLTIDIKDFFGSINPEQINRIFRISFNCDDKSAEVLTALTTYGTFLPQGAPTSPALANIAALPLDAAILDICEQSGLQFSYTRYVDDITISGDNRLALMLASFYKTVSAHGFTASPGKLRVGRPSNRQKVTGIIVNKKMAPPKKLIRKIRQQLYYCEKFGIEDHCRKEGIEEQEFLNQINGMLGFIRLTQPTTADLFKIKLTTLQGYTFVSVDESVLLILKHAVEEEKHVNFVYHGSTRKVAPVEVFIDDEGMKFMRGYQTVPEQKWERYMIPDIQSLRLSENA